MSFVPTPTTTLTTDEINPAGFDFWLRDDVHGAFARLRRERPVAWHQHADSGRGFWSLTRYDDVAAATRDWETFSSSRPTSRARSGPAGRTSSWARTWRAARSW